MSDLLVFRTESPKENVACRQKAQKSVVCRNQNVWPARKFATIASNSYDAKRWQIEYVSPWLMTSHKYPIDLILSHELTTGYPKL